MEDLRSRSAYSRTQLEHYLVHIRLDIDEVLYADKDLALLTRLQQHQLCRVPFANLSLLYDVHHQISLHPEDLYEKIVVRGYGGYCMENNIFFLHMLLRLGFRAYTAGARARRRVNGVPVGEYTGWAHAVIIVVLDGALENRYMVDVGFGGDGPIKPIPLLHDQVMPNIGKQELRLRYEKLPSHLDVRSREWIYEFRNGEDDDWKQLYAFTDHEFLPQDFEIMSYWTSTNAQSYVTYSVIVVKMLMDADTECIYGKIMLAADTIKMNTGGRTTTVKVCMTEPERHEALRKHFNITLTEREKSAISRRVAALPEASQ